MNVWADQVRLLLRPGPVELILNASLVTRYRALCDEMALVLCLVGSSSFVPYSLNLSVPCAQIALCPGLVEKLLMLDASFVIKDYQLFCVETTVEVWVEDSLFDRAQEGSGQPLCVPLPGEGGQIVRLFSSSACLFPCL